MQWITERLNGLANVNLVDVVTLTSLLVAGIQLARSQPKRMIRRYRRRYLASLGISHSAVDARVAVLLTGVRVSAADEVSWLADRLGVASGRALPFDAERATAAKVGSAYQAYVARLERGILFGKSHVPVVEADLARCRIVASSMRSAVGDHPVVTRDLTLRIAHRQTSLVLHGQVVLPVALCGRTVSGQDESGLHDPEFAVRDLAVSYRRHRVVTTDAPVVDEVRTLGVEHLEPGPEEKKNLTNLLNNGHTFDAALPRLEDWRVERNPRSGREVLHLSVAECTYSAVVLDHYPRHLLQQFPAHLLHGEEDDPGRPVKGDRVGVLTLSATVVTASDHVVFARRSASAGSHQRLYGAAINGNLEFESRMGLAADLDDGGWPDLRAALAREGREELGLDIEAAELSILGLGGFSVPTEVGTRVLLGQLVSDLSLHEMVGRLRHADPIEGAWELDGALLGLRLPETADELTRAVSWLVGSSELTPHATLAGLSTLAVTTGASNVWRMAEGSLGRTEPVERPLDLVTEVSAAGRGARAR